MISLWDVAAVMAVGFEVLDFDEGACEEAQKEASSRQRETGVVFIAAGFRRVNVA